MVGTRSSRREVAASSLPSMVSASFAGSAEGILGASGLTDMKWSFGRSSRTDGKQIRVPAYRLIRVVKFTEAAIMEIGKRRESRRFAAETEVTATIMRGTADKAQSAWLR